ncbi:MAG: hypothetical protein [Enterobacter phage ENC7]|uniref:hypothetical protein n=1 Tax=Enterobacter cloacae complex sp. 363J6 TaxID=3395868 RepID=UPI001BEF7AB9|nr:hypothetical protein [Escherichia phage UPEC03]UIW11637.1 MAG: hypothetical protein [Enterobacter phage ENC7]UIW11916.1 MAG: hypothetical protein [Enterobacter phage ENC25]UIW12174.1 MAG: hypothetical protein [Enterobacter phage ENC22]UJB55125.1 hypothetical protein [Enterobacter phage vB_EcRAM-01]URP86036.1 hypothetical protein ECF1_0084 [Enterobacter phage EC-F1]WFD55679.1 hypothetical protein phi5_199 [Enterobacter phage phi5]
MSRRPKNSKTEMHMTFDVNGKSIEGKPCTNSKFMHIAGLPGMSVKTSYDCHYNEETTSVYLGEELMAERVMQCVHFPGERPEVNCFIVGYHKGIVNEQV